MMKQGPVLSAAVVDSSSSSIGLTELQSSSRTILLLLSCWLLGGESVSHAQPNSPPPGVLMQLMQSQLPVDVNSPVVAKAEFDPPFVSVGRKAVYRVTLNALEASVRFVGHIPVPPGLKMTHGARGQIMPISEGMMRPQTALNFHVRAEAPGFFAVPAFTVEVYGKPVTVPGASLEVTPRPSEDEAEPRQLVLSPVRTNVFLGELVRVRVLAAGSASNAVDFLTQLQFNGDGFLDGKTIYRQQIETITRAGRAQPAWMIESSVTPLAAGPQPLTAQAFTAGLHFTGPVVLQGQIRTLGNPQRHVLLDSEPVMINVQPLPPDGNARGFTGFVGKLSVDRPLLSTNSLAVGELLTLRVTFRSEQSFARFTPPAPPRVAAWQVFPPTPTEPAASSEPGLPHAVAYAYTLIPNDDVERTPAIPFCYFDPEKAAYVDATIPALEVRVRGAALAAEERPGQSFGTETPGRRRLVLSNPAAAPGPQVTTLWPYQLQSWFWLAQLVPASVIAGLWYWDRRRRFLDAHPAIVRCRQARRALRRERRALRRAVLSGDAPGFVRRAVAALQIAAAPHFPAAPRALVCGEVLSLFDAREQGGRTGEVIRQFFARELAMEYSARPEQAMPLFGLRPELERILTTMEARL